MTHPKAEAPALLTMANLPPKRLTNFKLWLKNHGAELLKTTNEWEVLRFKAAKGTAIIYQDKHGALTLSGPVKEPWVAFCTAAAWNGTPKRAARRSMGTGKRATLIERDGCDCFYCGEPMEPEEMTQEHMLPVIHGGSNHVANLALSHEKCNQAAGNLSVAEKVRLRDRLRTEAVQRTVDNVFGLLERDASDQPAEAAQ